MSKLPDLRGYESISDLVDDSLPRLGAQNIAIVETPDGLVEWSADDLLRRSRLAAWRLMAAGVNRGEPVLTLAAAGPDQAALFMGAWRAGIIPVPLDQRLTPEVIARIAERAGTRWLVTDDGRALSADAEGVPSGHSVLSLKDLTSDDRDGLPADWEATVAAWPRPSPDDIYAIMYTSGTTGQPRGVMLAHRNTLEPWRQAMADIRMRLLMRMNFGGKMRTISVMPQSHLFGLSEIIGMVVLGVTVVYPLSRTPRSILESMRRHRPTTISVAPRFLELFWRQLVREIAADGDLESFERRRVRARRLPYWVRRRMFRSELARIGGKIRIFTSGAAYLPPEVQSAWESIGIPVMQGYGATECGGVAMTSYLRHPIGKVGKPLRVANVELAPDGEILVSGPGVTAGYWRDPEATSKAWDQQGRYHTGDIGRFDEKGDLVLLGRKKNIIVLSNGLNVYPEDIEAALHGVGLGDTVVLETTPGRIEAVILDPEREMAALSMPDGMSLAERQEALRERIDQLVRTANDRLTQHERIDGWRLWPEPDFPRTHTQKIRRDPVRQWASSPSSVPLPVRDGVGAEA